MRGNLGALRVGRAPLPGKAVSSMNASNASDSGGDARSLTVRGEAAAMASRYPPRSLKMQRISPELALFRISRSHPFFPTYPPIADPPGGTRYLHGNRYMPTIGNTTLPMLNRLK